MRTIANGLIMVALGVLAGCTPAAEPMAAAAGQQSCFTPRQVNGFNSEGDDTVYLRVSANHIYVADIGSCPDIDWTHGIAIRSMAGGSWICQGLDAELIVPTPNGVDRCLITDIRRLDQAEVEAYHRRN